MENQIVLYFLLQLAFISGSIYNFRIRKQCIYRIKPTKPRIFIIIIIPIIFCIIAYIGGNVWYYYLLSISASALLISRIVGEGIHEKGIYYHDGRSVLARLAKWEDIQDIRIDEDKNKLKSFKRKTRTIFPDQYYTPEDIHKINQWIKEE